MAVRSVLCGTIQPVDGVTHLRPLPEAVGALHLVGDPGGVQGGLEDRGLRIDPIQDCALAPRDPLGVPLAQPGGYGPRLVLLRPVGVELRRRKLGARGTQISLTGMAAHNTVG